MATCGPSAKRYKSESVSVTLRGPCIRSGPARKQPRATTGEQSRGAWSKGAAKPPLRAWQLALTQQVPSVVSAPAGLGLQIFN